jgi:hypothetical protein
VNEARHTSFLFGAVVIIGIVSLALPYLIAQFAPMLTEAAFGVYDRSTFWLGFPFRFVRPSTFGNDYRLLSLAYFCDVLFWAALFVASYRWLSFRRLRSFTTSNDKTRNA